MIPTGMETCAYWLRSAKLVRHCDFALTCLGVVHSSADYGTIGVAEVDDEVRAEQFDSMVGIMSELVRTLVSCRHRHGCADGRRLRCGVRSLPTQVNTEGGTIEEDLQFESHSGHGAAEPADDANVQWQAQVRDRGACWWHLSPRPSPPRLLYLTGLCRRWWFAAQLIRQNLSNVLPERIMEAACR
jgi:hypothetical protein